MDIAQIIAQKINGTLSGEEQEYFDIWMNESEENESLFYRLLDSGAKEDIFVISQLDDDEQWQKVLEKSNKRRVKTNEPFQLKHLLRYAAIFIGAIGVVYGYWQSMPSDQDAVGTEDVITLKLENGEILTISPENPSTITNAQGTVLGEQKEDRLVYSDRTKS